jgi:hypothetical protein
LTTTKGDLRTCDVDGCDGTYLARGKCGNHYTQLRRQEDPELADRHRASNRRWYLANSDRERVKRKQWAEVNKVRIAENQRITVATKRQRVAEIKLATGCTDCGYKEHAEALELDHLPGCEKVTNVASMVAHNWSWERIEAEIAKCEVVCANCHRVRTAGRRD